ncbi:glycosyltransferase [Acinetobacter radioresistens]|uniref:glycosyltransferase family 2 protein n=1 Tax=Bacteria TaxID=2 RepID=UPI000F7A10C7|nr:MULTISPECIES: glycosyltransferase [Bacteria]MCU4517999.1 glycosyltransferase [Acinetobacter radioresistens]RSO66534.1 glycosyltransferase [Acinetobacter radioresistens]
MKLDSKISVIIPVYNAQDTIEKTIQSITSQSYQNLEIILVNDGSTDSSYEICRRIQSEDSRIKIIDKENGGVSSARNMGVAHATGEYIIHADSDDIVLPNAYMNLIREANRSNAAIIVGGYYSGLESNYVEKTPDMEIEDPIIFAKRILENKIHAGLWSKLVKSNLYNNFQFKEGLDYKEDLIFFVTQLMKYKPKISTIKEPVYFYYIRENSITNQSFDKNVEKNFIVIKEIESLNYKELEDSLQFQKAYANIGYILNKKNSKYCYNDFYPNLSFLDLNIPSKYKILLFFEKKSIRFFTEIYLKFKELKK